jgi:hypothetical protein
MYLKSLHRDFSHKSVICCVTFITEAGKGGSVHLQFN